MGVSQLIQDHPVSDGKANERRAPGPEIEPGQIWLVECAPAALSAVHAELLSRANVVLYEPALAAAVADSPPLGIHAEKLQAVAASGLVIAPRALQFAVDGWSVVQLVEQLAGWRRLLRAAAEEVDRPEAGAPSLVRSGQSRPAATGSSALRFAQLRQSLRPLPPNSAPTNCSA